MFSIKGLKAILRKVPSQIIIGASGTFGGIIITVLVPYAWAHAFGHQQLIGYFAQPPEPEQNSDGKCKFKGPLGSARVKTKVSSEKWDVVVNGSRLSAQVTNLDETGREDVEGFDIRKNGAAPVDTITAAYRGALVGRGNYYLERSYDDDRPRQEWWQGYQVMYDCQHQEAMACPYVLGKDTQSEHMRDDPWLQRACWPATVNGPMKSANAK
jgi:hypothetical protein